MERKIGIDLGTTNTVITTYENGILRHITIDGLSYIPSAIFLPKKDMFRAFRIGISARSEWITGTPGRYIRSMKSALKTNFSEIEVEGSKISLSALIGNMFIKTILQKASLHIKSTDIVSVGYPVALDEMRLIQMKKRLLLALKVAGIENPALVPEPVAAAYRFEQDIQSDATVLIVDLGGGTSDFTIMRLGPSRVGMSDRTKDIIATNGIYVGGDDINVDLGFLCVAPALGKGSWYWSGNKMLSVPNGLFQDVFRWENTLRSEKIPKDFRHYLNKNENSEAFGKFIAIYENPMLAVKLMEEIEKAKHLLADESIAFVRLPEVGLEVAITKEQLGEAASRRISSITDEVMTMISLSEKPDIVVLTGGTSKLASVQERFREIFGERVQLANAFMSVGEGLTLA